MSTDNQLSGTKNLHQVANGLLFGSLAGLVASLIISWYANDDSGLAIGIGISVFFFVVSVIFRIVAINMDDNDAQINNKAEIIRNLFNLHTLTSNHLQSQISEMQKEIAELKAQNEK